MKYVIKNNVINSNIKALVLIVNTNDSGCDEDNYFINIVGTVPFLSVKSANKYIKDLSNMKLQGILVKTYNSIEEDILKSINVAREECN